MVTRNAKSPEQAARMLAIIDTESRGDHNARGQAGEFGLAQIMPGTAAMVGFNGPAEQLLDPGTNIAVLRLLLDRLELDTGPRLEAMLSGYNCGWSRDAHKSSCERADGTFANQGYVDLVLGALGHARAVTASAPPAPGPVPAPASPEWSFDLSAGPTAPAPRSAPGPGVPLVAAGLPEYAGVALVLLLGAVVFDILDAQGD